jgi:hypothetical protein
MGHRYPHRTGDAPEILNWRFLCMTRQEIPLHFYRYQCRFYVAHWDGGNVMSDNFRQFIELITEKTGIDAKRVEAVARDYFNNVD